MITPGQLLGAFAPRRDHHRRRWHHEGRAHIEVRGVERPEVGVAVEAALAQRDGVAWSLVNPTLGRVMVAFDDTRVTLDALVAVILEAEDAVGSGTDSLPTDRPAHPGDLEPLVREVAALGADVAAAGLALVGRVARLARMPVEVASLAAVVQSQPRLRALAETHLGVGPAHLSLAVVNALGQGLAQGPLGLVGDAAVRTSVVLELLARRALWNEVEPELCGPGTCAPRAERRSRPVPLPGGPVEQYADRATAAGAAGFAATSLTTGDVRRGVAAFLATTPKAAVQGREVFASHLGSALAARGIVCLDAGVLRRLDRIDCLVVDGRCVDDQAVGPIVVLAGADGADGAEEARDVAVRLFDPTRARREGSWTLRPLPARSPLRRQLDVRRALRDTGGDRALVLTRGGKPVAVVGIETDHDTTVQPLVDQARRAGWTLAVAHCARADADVRIERGSVADAVRRLQADGCAVAVISADAEALAAADCGLGIVVGDAVPWEADILCRAGPADARFLLEATAVAHEVSRQSAAIALAGAGIAALLGFSVPVPLAGARAMMAVNLAALGAQANGVRAARGLSRLPVGLAVAAPPWHEMPADEVLTRIGSSPQGLGKREAAARRRRDEQAGTSLPTAMLEELANPLTPVLAGAVALSAAVGSATDAAIVGAVTVLNATLGGTQRWRVDRAVRAMEEESGQFVRVLRDDRIELVPADTLVPGDVVSLQSGDSVPADCRIIRGEGLEVDESTVTGESVPMAKSGEPSASRLVAERTSMLYDGTTIAAGHADAVVVAVGTDTESGRAAAAAERETQPTSGVEARLSGLVSKALPVSALGGVAVALTGLARGMPLRTTLHSGVSLAVAAVPEGLPLLATMAQVSSARRLADKGVLVRNPRAIEALGRVDVLCADKTGTLTEGSITLQRVSDGERDVDLNSLSDHHRYVLAVALRASPAERDDQPLPHLTDRAVVDGAAGVGVHAGNGGHPWERRAELHFEPARGYHAVLGRNGGGFLLSIKGAPEVVLPRCDEWFDGITTRSVDAAQRAELTQRVDRLARRGFRILAVAERRASGKRDLADERVARLTLLGFVALADPVRPSAAQAVASLAAAGVRTVMMTGDHPSTAEGIAHELGILEAGRVVIGTDVDDLDDDGLAEVLPYVTVFARVTPAQKLRLVRAYRAAGHVVAMTGDGANDAPAIRLADVGVALGEHSTSGARRAADVVVPDGRIEALLDAIVEGRAMWASVREAVAILLGGNLGETVFTVAGAAVSGRPPLNPRQLLLVNLLTDAFPAMAIAGRGPRDLSPQALLAEGPDASLGRSLDQAIVARAATTVGGAGLAWTVARVTGRPARAGTVALAALVGTQLGQTLAGGGRDPWVVATSVGSAAVLFGIIQTPVVSQVFGCTPLGPVGWSIAGASAATALAVSAAVPPIVRALSGSDRKGEVAATELHGSAAAALAPSTLVGLSPADASR